MFVEEKVGNLGHGLYAIGNRIEIASPLWECRCTEEISRTVEGTFTPRAEAHSLALPRCVSVRKREGSPAQ